MGGCYCGKSGWEKAEKIHDRRVVPHDVQCFEKLPQQTGSKNPGRADFGPSGGNRVKQRESPICPGG
jgi:hypothetical protein